jgi:ankyrin repeat protein
MILSAQVKGVVKVRTSSHNAKHQLNKPTIRKADFEETPSFRLKAIVGAAETSSIEFRKPTEQDISSYDFELVKVVREKNVDRLREMFSEGRSMNACNQFGESLVHMVCRRGDIEILKFMIEEAGVSFTIKDDFGRNPFHDACWTPTPNFEVMGMLIAVADINLLLAKDVRGNTPFDYARKEHHGKWGAYLDNQKDIILKGLEASQCAKSI